MRGDDDAFLRQTAADVLDEDLRMQRLVEDLLLLARRDGRNGPVPTADHSLVDLVDLDDIALSEAGRVRTTKTVTTSNISAGQVRGSHDQLTRIVRNLLDNALRHAVDTVAISVTITDDGLVQLTIEDDGDGVAHEDREKIFARFGRADEARTRDDGGSGLGLAIVAGLVSDHDGIIAVDTSATLGGARFTATLTDART